LHFLLLARVKKSPSTRDKSYVCKRHRSVQSVALQQKQNKTKKERKRDDNSNR